jgi:hypothetical protein
MTNLCQHIQHLRRELHQISETQVRSCTSWANLENKKNERMKCKERDKIEIKGAQ